MSRADTSAMLRAAIRDTEKVLELLAEEPPDQDKIRALVALNGTRLLWMFWDIEGDRADPHAPAAPHQSNRLLPGERGPGVSVVVNKASPFQCVDMLPCPLCGRVACTHPNDRTEH